MNSLLLMLKKVVVRFLLKLNEPNLHQHIIDEKTSPAVKISQRQLFAFYKSEIQKGQLLKLSDVGFRNFSQFEEDGLLLYIFAAIGTANKTFVDIGAGNCINSNCTNLATNFGWHGLFIDGNEKNMRTGKKFFSNHPDTFLFPPSCKQAIVQRENINSIIESAGFSGEIDLVSIDIDGNDYWIWDALSVIQPRVVIIETHIEFGLNSIVVPYDKDYCYPGKHPDYHGASPVAMAKLAKKKGYRLVGANDYGFNTIYIKDGLGEEAFPEILPEEILKHPRNKERFKLFEPIADWPYEQV